jgi:hypothetical protein
MNGRVRYNSICSGREYSGQTTIIPCSPIRRHPPCHRTLRPRCMGVKHSCSPGIEPRNQMPIQRSSSVADSKIISERLSFHQKHLYTKRKSVHSFRPLICYSSYTRHHQHLCKNFVKLRFINLWVSTLCRVVELFKTYRTCIQAQYWQVSKPVMFNCSCSRRNISRIFSWVYKNIE